MKTDNPHAIRVVVQFNDALNARDLAGMLRQITPDCIFENTSPSPDGERYVGLVSIRAFWEQFFKDSRHAAIEIEEIFACGDRCIMRWTYRWVDLEGRPGHIRGVDLYRLEGDLIAEKLSYVKG